MYHIMNSLKYGAKIPHRDLNQNPTHIILRLEGSIPLVEIERIKHERINALNLLYHSPESKIPEALRIIRQNIASRYHLGIDEALHSLSNGPYHLNKPEIACLVMKALQWSAENDRWFLYAACIMGNHLHVVVRAPNNQESVPLGPIMSSLKRYTARQSNLMLKATGQAFWAPTYYDRDVRPGRFMRVMWYVLNNPVSAGLVEGWEDWPYTYLHPEYRDLFV
jgi:REP element-mobilizing transposase RayT